MSGKARRPSIDVSYVNLFKVWKKESILNDVLKSLLCIQNKSITDEQRGRLQEILLDERKIKIKNFFSIIDEIKRNTGKIQTEQDLWDMLRSKVDKESILNDVLKSLLCIQNKSITDEQRGRLREILLDEQKIKIKIFLSIIDEIKRNIGKNQTTQDLWDVLRPKVDDVSMTYIIGQQLPRSISPPVPSPKLNFDFADGAFLKNDEQKQSIEGRGGNGAMLKNKGLGFDLPVVFSPQPLQLKKCADLKKANAFVLEAKELGKENNSEEICESDKYKKEVKEGVTNVCDRKAPSQLCFWGSGERFMRKIEAFGRISPPIPGSTYDGEAAEGVFDDEKEGANANVLTEQDPNQLCLAR